MQALAGNDGAKATLESLAVAACKPVPTPGKTASGVTAPPFEWITDVMLDLLLKTSNQKPTIDFFLLHAVTSSWAASRAVAAAVCGAAGGAARGDAAGAEAGGVGSMIGLEDQRAIKEDLLIAALAAYIAQGCPTLIDSDDHAAATTSALPSSATAAAPGAPASTATTAAMSGDDGGEKKEEMKHAANGVANAPEDGDDVAVVDATVGWEALVNEALEGDKDEHVFKLVAIARDMDMDTDGGSGGNLASETYKRVAIATLRKSFYFGPADPTSNI